MDDHPFSGNVRLHHVVQVLKERIRELESSQGRTHMAGESAATVGNWKISGYMFIYHVSYIYISSCYIYP